LVAVVLEHQVGDAPDVDFRDHASRLSGEPLSTVNPTVWEGWICSADCSASPSPSLAGSRLWWLITLRRWQ
jgi:hypothetical protein